MEARVQPPQTLMRLTTGHQASRAICVAAPLGVPDLVRDGAKSSAALAESTGAPAPSLCRLLRALAALDIFHESAPDQFVPTQLGHWLCTDEAGSMRPLVLVHGDQNFWQNWGDLLHGVRSGQTAISHLFRRSNVFDCYAQDPEEESNVSAGFAAMAETFPAANGEAYDFSGLGTIVDVGSGRGQLLTAILRAAHGTRGILLDLPHVVQWATAFLMDADVADRCSIVTGNMFISIPPGGDADVLSRVIHDWEDSQAIAILAVCLAAMPDQAELLIVERALPIQADALAANRNRFLSDLNLLVQTGGRERTAKQYRGLMEAAGLRFTRLIPTSSEMSIVEGVRG